jgi:hypothetical protein
VSLECADLKDVQQNLHDVEHWDGDQTLLWAGWDRV